MFAIYMCIILLSILLSLFILIKVRLEFKYVIMGIDTTLSELKIYILNICVYRKNTQKKTMDIISSYINNKINKSNTKNQKISIQLVNLIKELIKGFLHLNITFGIKDSIIPIYIIPSLATMLSIYTSTNFKQKYIKNLHYNITPDYYHTYILINGKITFNLLTLIKVLKQKNNYKEEKHGKSSN